MFLHMDCVAPLKYRSNPSNWTGGRPRPAVMQATVDHIAIARTTFNNAAPTRSPGVPDDACYSRTGCLKIPLRMCPRDAEDRDGLLLSIRLSAATGVINYMVAVYHAAVPTRQSFAHRSCLLGCNHHP